MLKLIKHTGTCDHPDDPSLPFKLELSLRAPEFMNVAFVLLHGGTEDLVARSTTKEELTDWMASQGIETHPRLIRWALTGPDGFSQSGGESSRSQKVGLSAGSGT